MKDYHELKGHVSNSSLNILERSIREFKKFLYEDIKEESTSYFDFGTAMHMYILEPERFDKEVLIMDYTIPKSKQQQDFCKNYAKIKKVTTNAKKKAFLAAYKPMDKWEKKADELINEYGPYITYLKESPNKLVISPEIFKKIQSISLELKRHKKASKLLTDPSIVDSDTLTFNELQILWDYKGIKCKSMLDRVVIDKKEKTVYIVDLKTTSNIAEFKKSFEKYHYDRQLTFYGMALAGEIEKLADITTEELATYKIVGIIIAIDKIKEEVKVFKISEEIINETLPIVTDLLERAKWHIDNNKFEYTREYYEGDGYDTL